LKLAFFNVEDCAVGTFFNTLRRESIGARRRAARPSPPRRSNGLHAPEDRAGGILDPPF
jgi:hypothetical protein